MRWTRSSSPVKSWRTGRGSCSASPPTWSGPSRTRCGNGSTSRRTARAAAASATSSTDALLTRADVAEGQVDALADLGLRLRDGVQPVVLAGAAHDEQAAVRQLERQPLAGRAVPEVKRARAAERHGGD